MPGAFLVRFSSQTGKYTLSRISSNGQIMHIRISYSSVQNQFLLESAKLSVDVPPCASLEKLVRWIGVSMDYAVGGSLYESIERGSYISGGYDDLDDFS